MRSFNRATISTALIGCIALAPLSGCQNLPGGSKSQGTAIGAVGGVAAGALIDRKKRGRGALIGGLVGAGGGYLLGSALKGKDRSDSQAADEAGRRARENPANASEVTRSSSADINDDGFVTMDEVVAMQKAGLGDDDMIDRLRRTEQVFELTGQQERYLEDRGVSQRVIARMVELNRGDSRTASNVNRDN